MPDILNSLKFLYQNLAVYGFTPYSVYYYNALQQEDNSTTEIMSAQGSLLIVFLWLWSKSNADKVAKTEWFSEASIFTDGLLFYYYFLLIAISRWRSSDLETHICLYLILNWRFPTRKLSISHVYSLTNWTAAVKCGSHCSFALKHTHLFFMIDDPLAQNTKDGWNFW